jgi:hypothetical protein
MFDKAGNIYYDTEDARTGMYIVDTEGRMYNKFVDKQGQVSVTGGTRGGHVCIPAAVVCTVSAVAGGGAAGCSH